MLLLLWCLLLLSSISVDAFPSFFRKSARKKENLESSWGYTDLQQWSSLCHVGRRQSPISFVNVDPSEVVRDPALRRLNFSSNCFFPKDKTMMEIISEGPVMLIQFERHDRLAEDVSLCTITDPLDPSLIYHFAGIHFHANSEHPFRNVMPDVELHLDFLTHSSKPKNEKMLTLSVLLKGSNTVNSSSVVALQHVLVEGTLPKLHTKTTCMLTEDISVLSFLPARESYLLYDGSLTVPPCTENVRWIVMTSPVFISRVALGKMRDAMDAAMPNDFHRYGNARPPQALNGRRIYRFEDTEVQPRGTRKLGYLSDVWDKKKKDVSAVADTPVSLVVDNLTKRERLGERLSQMTAPPDDSQNITWTSSSTDVESSLAEMNTTSDAGSNDVNGAASASAMEQDSGSASATPIAPSAVPQPLNTSTVAPTLDESSSSSSYSRDNVSQESTSTTVSPVDDAGNATSSEPLSTPDEVNTSSTTASPKPLKPESQRRPKGRDENRKKKTPSVHKNTSSASEVVPKRKSKSTWQASAENVKETVVEKSAASVEYARSHPLHVTFVVAAMAVVCLLGCTCCIRWKKPSYVVGIDPKELQPLAGDTARTQYGSVNDTVV